MARAQGNGQLADREGMLLNRRIDVASLQLARLVRATGQWVPYALPSAKVYVLHVFGMSCAPCLTEFPMLRILESAWHNTKDVTFLFVADPPLDNLAPELAAYWQTHAEIVPNLDPLRCRQDRLTQQLDVATQPLTLLLDGNLVVRQAFIGTTQQRPLGAAIERLLRVASEGKTPARGR